eukprot:gene10428-biopygen22813
MGELQAQANGGGLQHRRQHRQQPRSAPPPPPRSASAAGGRRWDLWGVWEAAWDLAECPESPGARFRRRWPAGAPYGGPGLFGKIGLRPFQSGAGPRPADQPRVNARSHSVHGATAQFYTGAGQLVLPCNVHRAHFACLVGRNQRLLIVSSSRRPRPPPMTPPPPQLAQALGGSLQPCGFANPSPVGMELGSDGRGGGAFPALHPPAATSGQCSWRNRKCLPQYSVFGK